MDLEALVAQLSGAAGRSESLTHLEVVEPRPAREAEWPAWLAAPVREAFEQHGVAAPWAHQRRAADLAHAGRHTVVATGTASGKSLCYLLPALHAIESSRGPKGQRGAGVLYLAPTKALAQDQLAAIRRLGLPDLRCSDPRRRLHAGGARVGPRPRELRLDQPRHAPPLPAAGARPLVAVLRLAALRRRRRVPPLPRRLRLPRRPDPASAAPGVPRCYGADADVRAGLGDGRGARRVGRPADRARRDRGDRGRLAARAGWPSPSGSRRSSHGAARTAPRSAARRAGEAADLLTDLVVERRAHARLRPLAPRRRDRRADARGGCSPRSTPSLADRVAAYRGGYLPEERRALEDGAALRRAARAGGHQRPRARHRHRRARRRAARRLPGHAGRRCGSRSGRAGRAGRDALGGAGRPRRPARHLPRAPSRGAVRTRRSRPTSSIPTTPTCSARTCARPRPSRR